MHLLQELRGREGRNGEDDFIGHQWPRAARQGLDLETVLETADGRDSAAGPHIALQLSGDGINQRAHPILQRREHAVRPAFAAGPGRCLPGLDDAAGEAAVFPLEIHEHGECALHAHAVGIGDKDTGHDRPRDPFERLVAESATDEMRQAFVRRVTARGDEQVHSRADGREGCFFDGHEF